MSTRPQIAGEGDIIGALASTGIIPEKYLTRGMDRMGQLSFIHRGSTRFLSMIYQKYPKSKVVKTREHRIQEIYELDRVLDVTVSSAATDNHTTFGLSDNQARQLLVGDMLYVSGLFFAITSAPLVFGQVYADSTVGTANTVPATNIPPATLQRAGGQPTAVLFSNVFGQSQSNPSVFFTNYEPILVTGKGAPGSAGTGNTTVTVQRVWASMSGIAEQGGYIVGLQAPGLVTTATNTNDAGKIIAGTHQLLRGLPNFAEGSDAPSGIHKNPYLDNNFTQEFKYAVEITNESMIEQTWIGKTYLEIEQMLRSRQTALDMERTFLFGSKGKSMDTLGRVMYTMGGVIDHIPKDVDHILQYSNPSISYPGMLDVLDKVFKLGGSEERDMYCGMGLYTELQKAFWSSGYLRYDEEASKNFDIEIQSLWGAAGKVRVIPCYTLTEAQWDKRAIVIDNGLGAYVPTTHEGWDMKVEPNIQQKGQQIYKEQLVGIKGLERRFSQYQSIINFNV